MTYIPFWFNDPTILFNKNYLLQFWPSDNMIFEQKMNAISRLIIFLTILGLFITRKISILVIGILTLAILVTMYKMRKNYVVSNLVKKEGFKNNFNMNGNTNNKKIDASTLSNVLNNNYDHIDKKNPFGNVLLTDINDKPHKKSAPPAFNPDVYEDINKAVKKQTQMLYPSIKNTNKQLYGDLYDNYQMDTQMMQRFYSTPNTRVDNDQGAFGEWLYGNMPSSKSSESDGAYQRVADAYRYILI
uniref:Minor capsid protein P9 transmembrane helices domain-containing protein n=1 Tax=viral metagenome TaxID=1070528 RepID=A0A6C0IT57_9ZZZZ